MSIRHYRASLISSDSAEATYSFTSDSTSRDETGRVRFRPDEATFEIIAPEPGVELKKQEQACGALAYKLSRCDGDSPPLSLEFVA